MNLVGTYVHVRDASPSGWTGTVRSVTGTTYTIVDEQGHWRMVDYTRQQVTPL